eukprot:Skav231957  [mRNA]  locus=scaffold2806:58909:71433:- [translate_table: standard]
MFTATWPLGIRRLAADFLQNPVEVRAGEDQRERDLALGNFKSGSTRTLVATDVAARGLDIKAALANPLNAFKSSDFSDSCAMASVLRTEASEWKGGPTNTLLCVDGERPGKVHKRRNAAAGLFRALRKYPLTRALRYLDVLGASDLGVGPSDAARIQSRTICIFLMRKGARIPAHDHPGELLQGSPLEAYYYGAQVLGPHPSTYGLGPEVRC